MIVFSTTLQRNIPLENRCQTTGNRRSAFWKQCLLLLLLCCTSSGLYANIVTSNAVTGNWVTPATWAGNTLPVAGDTVVIANGATVTITASPVGTIASLTVGQGSSGVLQFSTAASTLLVSGNVTIAAGGTLKSGASGSVTHTLSLGGNFTNNGTYNALAFSTNSITTTFTGSVNQTVSGTGSSTNFALLAMSKTALDTTGLTNTVELNLSNFSVRGLSTAATGTLLSSGTGIGLLKFSGTNTFDGNLWSAAGYTVPATYGIWLNNPNFTVNAQAGNATNAGHLRVSNGTYKIGTIATNTFTCSLNTSSVLVDGGTLTTSGITTLAASVLATPIALRVSSGTFNAGTATTTLTASCLTANVFTSIILNGTGKINTTTGLTTAGVSSALSVQNSAKLSVTGNTIIGGIFDYSGTDTSTLGSLANSTVVFSAQDSASITITNGVLNTTGPVTLSTSVAATPIRLQISGGTFNAGTATTTLTTACLMANPFTSIALSGTGKLNATTGLSTLAISTALSVHNAAKLYVAGNTVISGIFDYSGTDTSTLGSLATSTVAFSAQDSASITLTSGVLNTAGPVNLAASVAATPIRLKISGGTFNIGTLVAVTGTAVLNTNANDSVQLSGGIVNVTGSVVTAANGTLAYTGGSLNVGGSMSSAGNYVQTNGTTAIVSAAGNSAVTASFAATGGTMTMSGGSKIILQKVSANAVPLDYNVSITPVFTGDNNILQIGNDSTASGSIFKIQGRTPNIVLNNASGNNPGILQGTALTVMGDMTLNGSGSFTKSNTLLTMAGNSAANPGNITVAGTNALTLNVGTVAASGLTFSSSFGNQTFSLGSGSITSARQIGALTIANTFNTTVPLSKVILPDSLVMVNSSILTLTAGILKTDTLIMGVTGPAVILPAAVTAVSYIEGAVKRTFSATTNSSTANTTLFPVGKNGIYMPINLGPAISGIVQLKAEAFTDGTGTNITPGIGGINAHYWKATNASATPGNLTSLLMRVVDGGVAAGDVILKSAANGALSYQTITKSVSTTPGLSIVTSPTGIDFAEFMGSNYYSFGVACTSPAIIAGPINVCAGKTVQTYVNKTGTWSSADPAIATIDASGLVTGVAAGTTTITHNDNSAGGCFGALTTVTVTVSASCAAPGGVYSGLNIWIKANAGITGTTPVTGWANQVFNGVPILISGDPNLNISAGTYNFNPYLDFTGNPASRQYLTLNANGNTSLLLQGAVFGAANLTDLSRVWTHFMTGVASSNLTPFDPFHGGMSGSNQAALQANGGAVVFQNNWKQNGLSVPMDQVHLTTPNIISTMANAGGITGNDRLFGGQAGIPERDWKGPVAEFFSYIRPLSTTERSQVESYLALKYGVTLNQATAQDYLASDGTTKMWNASNAGSGFNNDIFGIGRDDNSMLSQRVSKSSNDDGSVLTVATNNDFTNPNSDAGRTDVANLNFEVIANNNGTNTWTATGTPVGYKRLDRQWQVQENGAIGTVNIAFDTANATFAMPARVIPGLPYYLLTDPNGDGNYTDGTITALTNTAGSLWSTSADFTHLMKFTIATGALNAGNDTLACSINPAQTLTGTGPAAGIWSAQPGNPAGAVLGATTAGVANVDLTGAAFGVYHYLYTAAGTSDTMKLIYRDCNIAPGGVTSHLNIWYKADAGVSGGSAVTNWTDQSNNGFEATATGSSTPDATATTLNFNPALKFDGADDELRNTVIKTPNLFNAANSKASAAYVVFRTRATAPNYADAAFYYGSGVCNDGPFSGAYLAGNMIAGKTNYPSLTSTPLSSVSLLALNGHYATASDMSLKRNGAEGLDFASGGAYGGGITATDRFNIGHGADCDLYANTDIAEIIIYNDEMTATKAQQVQSYLALKYGIHLDQTTPQDYLASNGTTKMWSAATAASGFNHNIFGIGRDDSSALNQKVSRSVNTDGGVLIVATDNDFTAGNQDLVRTTALSNMSFETIAHNNGTNSWTSTGTLAGYKILNRQWQVQENGSVGTINIAFDTANAAFAIPARLTPAVPYFIITDPNADGNYSDGTVTALTNTSGSLWSTGIDLTNNSKFTIATAIAYAGADTFICASGSVIYPLTGAPAGSGIWTADPANPAGATLGSTTAGVAMADFTAATFGTYQFVYTLSGTTDTVKIAYRSCKVPGGVAPGLVSWYRSDMGMNASNWMDQTGTNNLSAVASPTNSNTLNFNTVASFNGTSQYYTNPNATGWLGGTNATTYYFVATAGNFSGLGTKGIYGRGTQGLQTAYNAGSNANWYVSASPDLAPSILFNATHSGPTYWTSPATHMARSGFNGGAGASYYLQEDYVRNGGEELTSPASTPTIATGGPFNLGKSVTAGIQFWLGDVAEVIAFNGKHTAADYNRINSYLALKYGIPLLQKDYFGTSKPQNYVASDNSLMWDTAAAATNFNQRIFGIGRDDTDSLNQKVSQSIDLPGFLVVATDNNFTANNLAVGRTALTNLSFETVADNGGNATWSSTNFFGSKTLLNREWQVQEHGTAGTTYLQFDADHSKFNLPAPLFTGGSYYLVTDPNGDGDYSDGSSTIMTHTSGSLWTVSHDFIHGEKFTIGAETPPLAGADQYACINVTAVQLTGTQPTTGDWTADPANPAGGATLSTTVNGVATANFSLAGAYKFIYTNPVNTLSDTMMVTATDCKAPGGVVANLALWLKADVGTYFDSIVSGNGFNWNDQSSNHFTGILDPFASYGPFLSDNEMNYNPSVFYLDESIHRFEGQALPLFANSSLFVAGIPLNAVQSGGSNVSWTTKAEGPGGANFENPLYKDIATGNVGHYGVGATTTTIPWANNEGSLFSQYTYTDRSVNIAKLGGTEQTIANAVLPSTLIDSGRYYALGNYPNGGGYAFGYISETIIYDQANMSATDKQKVESYMALKYGLTLDVTGPNAGTYKLSTGTAAWTGDATYQHGVIGIVKDTASDLTQKQSRTQDDSLRLFTGALAYNNAANTGVISNNASAIVIGHNGGELRGDRSMSKPGSIYTRFGRSWKVTNTNFADPFALEIKWDSIGTFDLSDIRLLVSTSPDFSGATVVNSPDVNFAIGSIIISGISNTIIPMNSTVYLTIGSVGVGTPLPLELLSFTATKKDAATAKLSWEVANATDARRYEVERSTDTRQFTVIGNQAATASKQYQWLDQQPVTGSNYYRIRMYDNNGKSTYSPVRQLQFGDAASNSLQLYPNPADQEIHIDYPATYKGSTAISVYNTVGQLVQCSYIRQTGDHTITLGTAALAAGIYHIKMGEWSVRFTKK